MIAGVLAAGAVELDGGWTLAMDPDNAGKTNGWAAAVRLDAKPAPVPGVIQQVYPHSCGVAWYWRRVARPATRAGERVILRFGAVDYYSDIYIDGTKIGSNEGAENTFEFDVTDSLKAESLLAVRLHVQDRAAPQQVREDGVQARLVLQHGRHHAARHAGGRVGRARDGRLREGRLEDRPRDG